jgi:hypothetical protein
MPRQAINLEDANHSYFRAPNTLSNLLQRETRHVELVHRPHDLDGPQRCAAAIQARTARASRTSLYAESPQCIQNRSMMDAIPVRKLVKRPTFPVKLRAFL